MRQKIKKQDAANAVSRAASLLYEVSVIREVATFIHGNHGREDCENVNEQINVLRAISEDKSNEAFHNADYAESYFRQQPKPKAKKKKSAILKAAA